MYTENGSKNLSGGFTDLSIENKIIPISTRIRCYVKQLDVYLSKISAQAHKLDIFHLRPLPNVPKDAGKPWFAAVPIGEKILVQWLKTCLQTWA